MCLIYVISGAKLLFNKVIGHLGIVYAQLAGKYLDWYSKNWKNVWKPEKPEKNIYNVKKIDILPEKAWNYKSLCQKFPFYM